jgi:hypothetical protein
MVQKKQGVSLVAVILVLGLLLVAVSPTGQTFIKGLLGGKTIDEEIIPEGYVFHGNLNVNIPIYDEYDDSTITATNIVAKLWHADQTTLVGSKTTPDGSDDITGEVSVADNGILYLSVDHAATTIYYIDDAKSDAACGYITAMPPTDTDLDGTLEHYFKVNLAGLTPLTAGETQKEITLSLYSIQYDAPSLITSSVNGTNADLSGSSYVDVYCTGYLDGITAGDGFKIVKIVLNTGVDGDNETYYEDGKVKDLWISLAYGYSKTYTWTSYDYAYSGAAVATRFTFNIGVTDTTQEVYGKNVLYEQNCGSTFAVYTVHIKGAGFTATQDWEPTLYVYYINPAGTVASVTQLISFDDP